MEDYFSRQNDIFSVENIMNMEDIYNEKHEISTLEEELEYIFTNIENQYELKARLKSIGVKEQELTNFSKDLLINWFRGENIIQNYSNCILNNFCKLDIINEYFISVYPIALRNNTNFANSTIDMNFSKNESDYIINGEIDISKVYKSPTSSIKNRVKSSKKKMNTMERGLYRRNNIAGDNYSMIAPEVERENNISSLKKKYIYQSYISNN